MPNSKQRKPTWKWLVASALALAIAITAVQLANPSPNLKAHPDAPPAVPGALTITPSPNRIETGQLLTLTGQGFEGTDPVRVYYRAFYLQQGQLHEPETVECPNDLEQWTHLTQISETPDDSNNWQYRLRITTTIAGDKNYIAFCGADSEGNQTTAAATATLNPESVSLEKDRAYPGETLQVTGRNWPALTNIRLYAVKGHVHYDHPDEDDCKSEHGADDAGDTKTVRTNREGQFETTYRLDGDIYFDLIQWTICADSGQRGATDHFHMVRVLRATVPEQFVQRQILLIGQENRLEIIPGIGADIGITSILIGDEAVWTPGDTDRTNTDLKTWVTITPAAADFSPGGWQVTARFDQEVGDAVQDVDGNWYISEAFELKETYEGEHYLIAPDTASPGDTIQIGGEGFAENQTGRIYAFPRPPETASERDQCPVYDPQVHTVGADVIADDDGSVPDTPITLADPRFEQHEEWLVCGVDGRGSRTQSHMLTIEPTIRSAEHDQQVLIREKDNLVKIVPDIDPDTTSVTGWTLGPESGGALERNSDGTYTIRPLAEAGRYTLEFTLNENDVTTTVSGVFTVQESGITIGDRHLSSDRIIAGPDETIAISGRGFKPDQTVRIYAQQLPYDDRLPVCQPYNRTPPDPAVTATTDSSGRIANVDFTLADQRFKDPSMDPWWFCAVDGAGDRTLQPLVVSIKRVLQFEHPSNRIIKDEPNPVWIAPPLPEGTQVSQWSIGDQDNTQPSATTTDEHRTKFEVTPSLPAGRYTMTARYLGGVLRAEVNVVDGVPTTVAVTPDQVVIGQEIEITGENHRPIQTITFLFFSPTEEDQPPDCAQDTPAFQAQATTDDAGDLTHAYQISEENFTEVGIWWVCSRNSFGKTTEEPAQFEVGYAILIDDDHMVRFQWTPARVRPQNDDATPVKGSIDGQPVEMRDETEDFSIRTSAAPGTHTLQITLSDETTVSREILVIASQTSAVLAQPNTARVGDEVAIHGYYHTPDQTVIVYFVAPTSENAEPDCATATFAGQATVTADQDGEFTLDYQIAEDIFTVTGTWWICTRDGAGKLSQTPGSVTIEHTVLIKEDQLIQFKWNKARIRPPLTGETSVSTATLAGQSAELRDGPDDTDTFRIRTTATPGTYTLVLTMSDDSKITREIEVIPQGAPPVLKLPENATFGQPTEISGSGFEPNSAVTFTTHPADGPNEQITCLDSLAVSTGTEEAAEAHPRTNLWNGEAVVSDADGHITLSGTLSVGMFAYWGYWGICAEDAEGSVTQQAAITQTRPGVTLPGEGRVRANGPAAITITPAPKSGSTIEGLKLGKRVQAFSHEDSTVTWLNVPEILGDHTLYLTIDGITTETVVTILSGRKPDDTIPADAKECPGLTITHDGQAPGIQTAMSFRFTIRPAGGLDCHVPTPDDASSDETERVVLPAASTVMPNEEIVIELRPDYAPTSIGTPTIHVTTYASRFAHQYRAIGARLDRSTSSNDNHRIVIPPCTSWTDNSGDAAPCVIAHAKEIRVHVRSRIAMPTDAAKEYATQVKYDGRTIYDIVAVNAAITAQPERVPFNGELTIRGDGFIPGQRVQIKGINTLDDSFAIPEEEEEDQWNCRLILEHGHSIDEVTTTQNVRFTKVITVTDVTFTKPGHWQLCAQVQDGARTTRPEHVIIDYQALTTATSYLAGVRSHIRINPAPPEDAGPTGMTVDGTSVNFEADGDVVNFVMPVNASGSVPAIVEFPQDLKAETKLSTVLPSLSTTIQEPNRKARIGSTIKVEATQIGGQQICKPELDGTPVQFILDDAPRDCVPIGPNQRFKALVRITGPGGLVTSELVKVFNDHSSAELTMTTDRGGVLSNSISLLRPDITIDTGNSRRYSNVLRQYQPVEVKGQSFPKDTTLWTSPEVGYRVTGQKEWNTRAGSGQWKDTFRLKEAAADEVELEFVPTINGHNLPSLSKRLKLAVTSPEIDINPSDVQTGTPIEIKGSNLNAWIAGWWIAVLHVSGFMVLTDHETGNAVSATSNGEGEFTVNLTFPDYEADEYDEDNKAVITLQLYNNIGEPIPGATIEINHTRPDREESDTGAGRLPTVTPIATGPYKPAFVTRTGPTPTPPVWPTLTVQPLPTRPPGWTGGDDESVPHPVDHSAVLFRAAQDGTSITLEWDPAGGSNPPTGYIITRSHAENGIAVPVAVPHEGTVPLYRDHDVRPGSTYWYYIEAYNQFGNSGFDNHAPTRASTPPVPNKITHLGTRLIGATIIRIAWRAPEPHPDRSAQVQAYLIEIKKPDDDEWTPVTQVSRYIREWVIINLEHGNDYEIRVAAKNGVGAGPWSDQLFVTTAGQPVLPTDTPPPAQAEPQQQVQPSPTPPAITPTPTEQERDIPWWIFAIVALSGLAALALIVIQIRRRAQIRFAREARMEAEREPQEEPELIEVEQEDQQVHTLPEPNTTNQVPDPDDEEEQARRRFQDQDDGEIALDDLVNRLYEMDEEQNRRQNDPQ